MIPLYDYSVYLEWIDITGYAQIFAAIYLSQCAPAYIALMIANVVCPTCCCIQMQVKADRLFHGHPYTCNRWKHLGLLAAGTGIAPLFQIIKTILEDPNDHTTLSLVFANRTEQDILLREELDSFERQFPEQFRAHYVLSQPPNHPKWEGGRGWVGAEDIQEHLPSPDQDNVMVMICGQDQFLDTLSGRTVRGPPPPGKKKGPKLQGPLQGLLSKTKYTPSQVYKF